jgi:hypothetical protein
MFWPTASGRTSKAPEVADTTDHGVVGLLEAHHAAQGFQRQVDVITPLGQPHDLDRRHILTHLCVANGEVFGQLAGVNVRRPLLLGAAREQVVTVEALDQAA